MSRKVSQVQLQDPLAHPLLTEQDAAEILGVTLEGLQRLRRQGAGPAHVQLSPKLIRYQPGAVQAWITERTQEGQAS